MKGAASERSSAGTPPESSITSDVLCTEDASHPPNDSVTESAIRTLPVEERLSLRLFSQITASVPIVCVVATPGICGDATTHGFRQVIHWTGAQADYSALTSPATVLIVAGPEHVREAKQAVTAYASSVNVISVVVFLVSDDHVEPLQPCLRTPPQSTGDESHASVRVQAFTFLSEPRREALAAGADEVFTCLRGEVFEPHRVLEVLQRLEVCNSQTEQLLGERTKELQHIVNLQHENLHLLMNEAMPELDQPGRDFYKWVRECSTPGGDLLTIDDLVVERFLGKGGFASVYQACDKAKNPFAVKVLDRARMRSFKALVRTEREIRVGVYLQPHENVVQLLEVLHTTRNLILLMEYGGCRTVLRYVSKLVQDGEFVAETVASMFSQQMAAAVQHLHESQVCHRDLKPANWLVSDDGSVVKLCDFGLAARMRERGDVVSSCCGSWPFIPPEVIRPHATYSGLCADMWSLSLNFLYLLSPALLKCLTDEPGQRPGLRKMYTCARGFPAVVKANAPAALHCHRTGLAVLGSLRLRPGDRATIQEIAALLGTPSKDGVDAELFANEWRPCAEAEDGSDHEDDGGSCSFME